VKCTKKTKEIVSSQVPAGDKVLVGPFERALYTLVIEGGQSKEIPLAGMHTGVDLKIPKPHTSGVRITLITG